MVKQKKTQAKKQQKKGGIDFKKIKRKIGRKLPPAQNATNTEIKTKAIVLPEQTVASDKAGLAVNRKGLTLKELLQQTSHHNAKVRKDALIGIKDIFLKHPAELRLHKLAAIEKLRERMSDDDKLVRDTLYQLLKSVVLPGCKDDNQRPVISLLMAYIFNAMTHLAMDVRMMAFKFLDLIVQNFPSTFSFYGEKILQSYRDMLRKGQFHSQDKNKLKNVLIGLVHCLALLPCSRTDGDSSLQNAASSLSILHAFESDASGDPSGFSGLTEKLKDLLPVLISSFQDFASLIHSMPALDGQSFECLLFILESLDLIVKFFCNEIGRTEQSFLYILTSPKRGPTDFLWGQLVPPSLLHKLWDAFPLSSIHNRSEQENDQYFIFNAILTEIFFISMEWDRVPSALLEIFLTFFETSLIQKISNCRPSGRPSNEKHLLVLVSHVPKLLMQASDNWRYKILQVFTQSFKSCCPESNTKLACVLAMQEMLDPENDYLPLLIGGPEVGSNFIVVWIRELPLMLISLGDKFPSVSKAVVCVLLLIGKAAELHHSFSQEYNQIQYTLKDFYAIYPRERGVSGPFSRLTRDIQELSLSCLYYFFSLDTPMLQSLVSCCLVAGEDVELCMPIRIIEVIQMSYRAGNIKIADYISFHLTLLDQFRACPEETSPMRDDGMTNRLNFRSIVGASCSCISQLGDSYSVFHLLETVVIDQLLQNPPMDNFCALLRVLVSLDSKPTRLSQERVIKLSQFLPKYLLDIASASVSSWQDRVEDSDDEMMNKSSYYYLVPCFFLFDRTSGLIDLVLHSLESFIIGNDVVSLFPDDSYFNTNHFKRIDAVLLVLLLIYKDKKMRQKFDLHNKDHIKTLLQTMLTFQSSEEINLTTEERHKAQTAIQRLKTVTGVEY